MSALLHHVVSTHRSALLLEVRDEAASRPVGGLIGDWRPDYLGGVPEAHSSVRLATGDQAQLRKKDAIRQQQATVMGSRTPQVTPWRTG